MTDKHVHTAEFDAKVDRSGSIRVPEGVLNELGVGEGGKLAVRVTGPTAMASLRKSGVTNEEIDRIAAMQLESPGQVVKFLLSEGALRTVGKRKVSRRGSGSR